MQLAADLHIHSCLSPCGDMLMTPNNIVNMAYIKGLDVIAVADHNTAQNLPAVKTVADARGILLLPALEVESREEVHVLCYLPDVDAALEFSQAIYPHIPYIKNKPDFFGEQIAMNDDDEPIYTEPKLLIQSTDISIDALADLVRSFGGVPVPAHINRTSNSLLSNLGFIPPETNFTTVEVYRNLPVAMSADLSSYHVIYSSDAHILENIFERDSFITVSDRSTTSILSYFATKK